MLYIEDILTTRASETRLSLDEVYLYRPDTMRTLDGRVSFSDAAAEIRATSADTPSRRFEGVLVDRGDGSLGIITPGTLAEAVLDTPSLGSRTLADISERLEVIGPGDPPPFHAHNFAVGQGGTVVAVARNPVYVVLTTNGTRGTKVCG